MATLPNELLRSILSTEDRRGTSGVSCRVKLGTRVNCIAPTRSLSGKFEAKVSLLSNDGLEEAAYDYVFCTAPAFSIAEMFKFSHSFYERESAEQVALVSLSIFICLGYVF